MVKLYVSYCTNCRKEKDMKSRKLSIISLILTVVMLLGIFASCSKSEETTDITTTTPTETTKGETTESKSEETTSQTKVDTTVETTGSEEVDDSTESDIMDTTSTTDTTENTESSEVATTSEEEEPIVTTETEEPILISGDNAELIHLSNKLANGVSPYYSDSSRNELTISNMEMDLGFNMTHANGQMLVSHISTKDGHSYIKDTMDVFVETTDKVRYYSGNSANISGATLNIYRYGYYYYENRLEGLSFVNDITPTNVKVLDMKANGNTSHGIDNIDTNEAGNGIIYEITGSDPYLVLKGIKFPTEEFDYVEFTIKATGASGSAELYIIAGNHGGFSTTQVKSFGVLTDGEAHTYRLPLSAFKDYTGTVKGMRFDIDGRIGTSVEISDLKVYKGDLGGAPTDLTLQRSFLTYSNKLHHVAQIATYKEVEDIQKVGMVTRIPVDSVDKIIAKAHTPKGDFFYYNLDDISGWNRVQYVGFDIKDAGIFGFILPYDGSGGTIKVEIVDGYYVIEQTKVPTDNKLIPSCVYYPEKDAEAGRYTPIKGNNGNDFFIGQRIYTDENHNFDEFIHEAECEVNPLTEENITVDLLNSDNASFAGYDALYGYYKFTVAGTGFNQAYYKYPNKHYSVKFSITGDEYDRQMYFMTYTSSGQLECAVLLDDKQMMLPIPLEVAKNFKGDGENNIYNNEDNAYGEVYFPMVVKSGEQKEFTIVDLYQNWGNVPLKQLSSIQYHTPYYHLSTGVTETNCIVPFAVVGPALPDFRGMSAPVWKGQPQHTSGGGHSFLCYTDATGAYRTTDTTGVRIDSYGPTYAEISLDYASSDGKIVATYTHMEMPQTDENRSYYEMKYTVLEDVEIKDFKNEFRFYYCTDNNSTGSYKKLGYLDKNNEYQVADVADSADYVLGDECPYFSLFMMPDYMRDNPHAEGYTNLAFLIYNSEFIINGEKVETNFYLRNRGGSASLSLNLENVSLKAGDTFTINAILMPWGSQELEDDPANRLNQSHIPENYHGYTYSSVLPDGTLYMDKNVRDVRENTLLNPLKATADKDCEVIASTFVPKVKTTNGKTAEFTLSGGHNNCAVRVYGFDMLTAPKVEEFVDGEWVEYELNSINHEDGYGYAHYYDGYAVHYDGDGTYSYSFVVPMDNGAPRKFRIAADTEFEGWPEINTNTNIIEDPIKHYLQPEEILMKTANTSSIAGALLSKDRSYISMQGHASVSETYMYFFSNQKDNPIVTGQYVVVKYRIPTGMNNLSQFEFFASTDLTISQAAGEHQMSVPAHTDDQWHILIVNLADKLADKEGVFVKNDEDEYVASFVRWDLLNQKVSADMYIDVAYFGLHDNLEEIYAMELNKEIIPSETPKYIELVEGGKTIKIDPKTGEEYVPVYVDPENEQGYKISDVEYAAWIDFINRTTHSFSMHNNKQVVEVANPTRQTIGDGILVLTGWAVVDGGVDKYVWSADGGKTWHDVVMYNDIPLQGADDAMIEAFGSIKAYTDANGNTVKPTVSNIDASKVNGGFSGSRGICADLMNYFEQGDTVNVTFAAVPKADTSSLCIIGHVTNVEVFVAPPIEPSETVNKVITPQDIKDQFTNKPQNHVGISGMEISAEGDYVRINSVADKGDSYTTVMTGNTQHTGQYLFIKYRIPTDYSTLNYFEVFTSTVNAHFQGGDSFRFDVIQDGEWHVVIVDVSQKLAVTKFCKNTEGRYLAKYLRIDVFDAAPSEGMYVDIATAGFADNLDVIYKEICSDMDYVTVVGSSSQKVDPATGEVYVKSYIDPTNTQGYTKSDVEFAGYVDMVNGMGGSKGTAKSIRKAINSTVSTFEFADHSGTTLEGTQLLTFTGWLVVNGGFEKIVWSADGGKTWHDVEFYLNQGFGAGADAHFKQLTDIGAVVTDKSASLQKVTFQGGEGGGINTAGLAANLAEYAGQKVNVTFAAVPTTDTDGLCILLHVTGIQVPAATEVTE